MLENRKFWPQPEELKHFRRQGDGARSAGAPGGNQGVRDIQYATGRNLNAQASGDSVQM